MGSSSSKPKEIVIVQADPSQAPQIIDWSDTNLTYEECKQKLQHLLVPAREFKCGSCRLTAIPYLSSYQNLTKLVLHRNEITAVDCSHIPLSIIELYLSTNKIKLFPDFSKHVKLSVLHLSDNLIAKIKVSHLPVKLSILHVSKNQLRDLPDLNNLPNLKKLYASNNQITSINGAHLPVSIVILDFDYNQINEITELGLLSQLQELYLKKNNIAVLYTLPSNIRKITLRDNPIKKLKLACFPSKMVYDSICTSGSSIYREDSLQQAQISQLSFPPPQKFHDGYDAIIQCFRDMSDVKCDDQSGYRDMCLQLLRTLGLSAKILEPEQDMCYCSVCHKQRGDSDTYNRGNPPKCYGTPLGWYRFGLKHNHNTRFSDKSVTLPSVKGNGLSTYQYTATKLWNDLPAAKIVGGEMIRERTGHFHDGCKPEGFNTKRVFVSPSVNYAGLEVYAASSSFTDSRTMEEYSDQAAFQVLIAPGSYSIEEQTVGAVHSIDPNFPNAELEWATDEQGAVIIYGLLVKLVRKL